MRGSVFGVALLGAVALLGGKAVAEPPDDAAHLLTASFQLALPPVKLAEVDDPRLSALLFELLRQRGITPTDETAYAAPAATGLILLALHDPAGGQLVLYYDRISRQYLFLSIDSSLLGEPQAHIWGAGEQELEITKGGMRILPARSAATFRLADGAPDAEVEDIVAKRSSLFNKLKCYLQSLGLDVFSLTSFQAFFSRPGLCTEFNAISVVLTAISCISVPPTPSTIIGCAAGVGVILACASCNTGTYSIGGKAGTPNATLTAGGMTTTSDSTGNYNFTNLAAGNFTVTPSKSGCTFSPKFLNVSVPPSAAGENFAANCTSVPAPYGVDAHTVALWHFEDPPGNVVADATGVNTGTATGTSIVHSLFGHGRLFRGDGLGDYITVPDSPSLRETGQLSIEAWVDPTNFALPDFNGAETIVGRGDDSAPLSIYQITMLRNGDTPSFNYFTVAMEILASGLSSQAESTVQHPPGQWYYIVGTYDGDKARVYVNGVLEAEGTSAPGLLVTTGAPLFIDNHTWANSSQQSSGRIGGIFDEIRLSNSARSASEIAAIYSAAVSSPINLTGTWTGTGSDSSGAGQFQWQATQSGLSVSGPFVSTDPTGNTARGTMAGQLAGTTLSFNLTIPVGGYSNQPSCSATANGSGQVTDHAITATYSGQSCQGPFTNGQLTLNK